MRKLIRKLSDMRGISGFEYRLTDQIADMFKKYCDLYGDPKSNFYIQNAVPLHTIYEVDYALSNSSINDYKFHVDDRADKLQVIEETGATRTFNRHAGNVSIESYSANGQRVNDMSADLAYEVWTVHTRQPSTGSSRQKPN